MRARSFVLVVCMAALAACSGSSVAGPRPVTAERAGLRCGRGEGALGVLLLGDAPAPIPFAGSDGRHWVVYELPVTNASSREITVAGVEITSGDRAIRTLSAEEIATRLEPLGTRSSTGTLGPSDSATLFVALTFDSPDAIPEELDHRITITAAGVPEGRTQTGCTMPVDRDTVVRVMGPPLAPGERYIAADSCCEATRHTRAPLVIDGRIFFAQRAAVDWEQVDAEGRFVTGEDPSNPAHYAIYGTQVIAAAPGTVVQVVDGLADQVPGALPTGITFDQVDGNSVIIDHGDGTFALYAHMQAGSVAVEPGQRVTRGQRLGLVGNSGNSSAPHLHFHLMDGPTLGSNGLPYVIDSFRVTGTYASTAIFDQVENTRSPLPIDPVQGDTLRTNALPLDRSVVTFEP